MAAILETAQTVLIRRDSVAALFEKDPHTAATIVVGAIVRVSAAAASSTTPAIGIVVGVLDIPRSALPHSAGQRLQDATSNADDAVAVLSSAAPNADDLAPSPPGTGVVSVVRATLVVWVNGRRANVPLAEVENDVALHPAEHVAFAARLAKGPIAGVDGSVEGLANVRRRLEAAGAIAAAASTTTTTSTTGVAVVVAGVSYSVPLRELCRNLAATAAEGRSEGDESTAQVPSVAMSPEGPLLQRLAAERDTYRKLAASKDAKRAQELAAAARDHEQVLQAVKETLAAAEHENAALKKQQTEARIATQGMEAAFDALDGTVQQQQAKLEALVAAVREFADSTGDEERATITNTETAIAALRRRFQPPS